MIIFEKKKNKKIKKLLLGRKLPYGHDYNFCDGEFSFEFLLHPNRLKLRFLMVSTFYLLSIVLPLNSSSVSFLGAYRYICVFEWNRRIPTMVWGVIRKFLEFRIFDCFKMHFPAWTKVFLQVLLQEIWAQYLSAHTNSRVLRYVWVWDCRVLLLWWQVPEQKKSK